MKSLKNYLIPESQNHMWANPDKNMDELKKFDAEKHRCKKLEIGMGVIAKNHNTRMVVSNCLDEGQLLYVIENGSKNVPVVSDVKELVNELNNKGCLEVDTKWSNDLYLTYYFDDEPKSEYEYALKEYKDADGGVNESKESYFYGIKPYTIIWHGEWSDPEITDGKKKCNYWDVEDSLWDYWKHEIDNDKSKTDKEMEEKFEEWMKSDEAKELTKEYFDNVAK